jgi:enoyl-CoA hydratase
MNPTLAIVEPHPGVMLLTLDRPAQRNALDLDLTVALETALASFEEDARWRVAVLTGRAPAFCAGLDLKTFSAPDAPRARVSALINGVARLAKPILAAVNGAAYTGGLELALACDFAIAGQSTRFADTHAKIGALSGSGMGARLPHAVGQRFAKQMMLTCEPIDAATALRVGLVNEVVADQELMPRALALAAMIAQRDPELARLAKGVVDRGAHGTLAEAIEIEQATLAERKARGAMGWTRS